MLLSPSQGFRETNGTVCFIFAGIWVWGYPPSLLSFFAGAYFLVDKLMPADEAKFIGSAF